MGGHGKNEKEKLTGARILWECLEREGVKTVFGYPGGAALPFGNRGTKGCVPRVSEQ